MYRICLLATGLASIVVGEAAACPFCDPGPAGVNLVKAAIFSGDFWFHLTAIGLPFVVTLCLGSLVAREARE